MQEYRKYQYDYKSLMQLIQGFTDRCAAIGPKGEKACSVVFTWMDPKDFLSHTVSPDCYATGDKAPECSFDEGALDDLRKKMKSHVALDVPFLDLTSCTSVKVWKPHGIPTVPRDFPKEKWKEYYESMKELPPRVEYCANHEGRHRAFVADELGFELPVVLMMPREKVRRCVIKERY